MNIGTVLYLLPMHKMGINTIISSAEFLAAKGKLNIPIMTGDIGYNKSESYSTSSVK